MNQLPDWMTEVRRLIGQQGASEGDRPDPVGAMQRLCRAAAGALPATGVAVSLIGELGAQVTVAASAVSIEGIEELQFSLGEGPCLEAYEARRPVLIPDIRAVDRVAWPGYALAAGDHGVRAVFAFPLQVGGARLGVMDVYRDEAGALSLETLRLALTFAEVATTNVLDAHLQGSVDHLLHDAVDNRYQVFQAQGIVMVQLGVSLVEAMARIRAHAYAQNRRLSDVADEIVAGRLTLESDAP
jgi:GAF domain/ANTAR domain